MSGTKLRNYCWTYFAEELEIEENEDIKYCVFQKEKCPKSGKIHFQGYVELKKPMRIKATQEALGIEGAHMEKRIGTRDEARDYCMKEESRVEGPWEIGEFDKGQGKRNDLSDLKVDSLSLPLSKVVWGEKVKNLQHLRFAEGLQKYRYAYKGERKVHWYYGSSGSGKSRTACEEAEGEHVEEYDEISYANGFWIGYRGSDRVIINDLRANVPLAELLRILDRYPIQINVKGGSMPWMAKEIWITTDRTPSEMYRVEAENGQLTRRISDLRLFGTRMGHRDEVGGNTSTPTSEDTKTLLMKMNGW